VTRENPLRLKLSVIVPAFNEARALPDTLARLDRACRRLPAGAVELIVVDNASVDETAQVAEHAGARVVLEPIRGVARARNTGASSAGGESFVFVDADVAVPDHLLTRLEEALSDPSCLGGAVDLDHRPSRRVLRVYLRFWRIVGLTLRMAQGGVQFCTREAFAALGGYDERIWMGEDVDFYWRLRRLGRRRGGRVEFVRDVRVAPSPRRFDQWPLWRTVIWTNPFAVTVFSRWRRFWTGWYVSPPR
jgi:glycosyltransferase involved in cell wall biosynthesis